MGIIFADDATQRQCRHQGGVSMRAISWNLLSQTGSPGKILILISSVLSHIIYLKHIGLLANLNIPGGEGPFGLTPF